MIQSASSRIAERLNWRTISFLLENLVFLLIGLQARGIIDEVAATGPAAGVVVVACLATLATVILTRIAWVFPARFLLVRPAPRRADRRAGRRGATPPCLGWAGMRGVVTLAAAFVIPADFAQREVLVLIALVVTAGTLFIQGLTLPWLVRGSGCPGPTPARTPSRAPRSSRRPARAGRDVAGEPVRGG